MNAFRRFNLGVMKTPVPVRLWLVLLVSANMGMPLFFLNSVEAQVVLVVFLLSFTLMVALTGRFGFSRIIGLGHILWAPMLVFLWSRLSQRPANDVLGIWIRVLVGLNIVSLVFDTIDAVRYFSGDRAEMVDGLE